MDLYLYSRPCPSELGRDGTSGRYVTLHSTAIAVFFLIHPPSTGQDHSTFRYRLTRLPDSHDGAFSRRLQRRNRRGFHARGYTRALPTFSPLKVVCISVVPEIHKRPVGGDVFYSELSEIATLPRTRTRSTRISGVGRA